MIEETNAQENELPIEQESELPVDQLDCTGDDPLEGDGGEVAPAVELPFVAPTVEVDYSQSYQEAGRDHFKIRLLAMRHYVNCCEAEYRKYTDQLPIRLFVNVPIDNHGFGSFIVVHLDNNQCVSSLEYVSCDPLRGMQSQLMTPPVARAAISAEWGSVAYNYENTHQLQRWGRVIVGLNLVRDYNNTELFDLLARVPLQD